MDYEIDLEKQLAAVRAQAERDAQWYKQKVDDDRRWQEWQEWQESQERKEERDQWQEWQTPQEAKQSQQRSQHEKRQPSTPPPAVLLQARDEKAHVEAQERLRLAKQEAKAKAARRVEKKQASPDSAPGIPKARPTKKTDNP